MLIQPKISQDSGTSKAVFQNVKDNGYWKVGQVLRVGEIVTHKGECVQSLMLEPQGIAHLISEETIELPDDVCALAHVLTRRCNDGLLTLGIGVIDPGWKDKISSPILNFSAEKRLLQVGDQFIRVTFHRITQEPDSQLDPEKQKSPPPDDYLRQVRARAVGDFGKSFLNVKQLVASASKRENQRFREAMLKYVPIGAFSLAFCALLITIGIAATTAMIARLKDAEPPARIDSVADQQRLIRLEEQVKRLQGELLNSQPTRLAPSTLQDEPKPPPSPESKK